MTGASSWLSHVQGAVSLLRVRGYRNFMTTFGQRLYLGAMLDQVSMHPLRTLYQFHVNHSCGGQPVDQFYRWTSTNGPPRPMG